VIVVSNSTVIIGLSKIRKLDLLQKIFSRIYVPDEVCGEIVERGKHKAGSKEIRQAEWIERRSVKDRTEVNLLLGSLERGEAEVLVLAKELKADLVLLDEEKARKSAIIAGFEVMGIVGLLIVANNLGLIGEIRSYIEELRKKKFRIGEKIILDALRKVGEER